MNRLKSIVKKVAGETLLRTGIWERYLRRMARRKQAIVLTYHRVIEKWDRTLDYSQPGMVVTAETFDRQLHFLKKHFEIIPLSSLISDFEFRISKCSDFRDAQSANPQSEIPKSKFGRPMCALTFDDGWRDNYEIAFPILQKHSVPATIFLTTDFIGTDRAFWHTELLFLLMHGDVSGLARDEAVFGPYPVGVRSHLMRIARKRHPLHAQDLDSLIETVKAGCHEQGIQDLIRNLANTVGIGMPFFADTRFFMDWDQVRAMAAAGIEIGSHGCSHRILTRVRTEYAEDELIRSKAEVEQRIDREVLHFAFPDGAANRNLIEAVRRAGYTSACLLATAPDQGRGGFPLLRRVGMQEGASAGSKGSFSETSLITWLLRAPRFKPELLRPRGRS